MQGVQKLLTYDNFSTWNDGILGKLKLQLSTQVLLGYVEPSLCLVQVRYKYSCFRLWLVCCIKEKNCYVLFGWRGEGGGVEGSRVM